MATATELQTRLDNLEAVLHSGTLSSEFNGQKVKYNSKDELIYIINLLRAQLGLPSLSSAAEENNTYIPKIYTLT